MGFRPPRYPRTLLFLALPVLLFCLFPQSRAYSAAKNNEVIISEARGEKNITLYGENKNSFTPYHVVVTFRKLNNFRASVPLPARVVLPPGQKTVLVTLQKIDPRGGGSYGYSALYGAGDPSALPDLDYKYIVPYEHGKKHVVCQGYFGAYTHQNRFSLDFEMPEGTPVCAARDGVVTKVKDDSSVHGLGPEFGDKANYVEVLHSDGTWAVYAHLMLHGVRVRPGDRVTAGQVIALSDNTGQSSGPHLHFDVNRATWGGLEPKTVPTKFLYKDGVGVPLEEGKFYYSFHPGGAPFEMVTGDALVEADLDNYRKAIPLNRKIVFRKQQIDDRFLLFCANGTTQSQTVTLFAQDVRNLAPSKKLPLTKVVPADSEVYFVWFTTLNRSSDASFRYGYKARPVR